MKWRNFSQPSSRAFYEKSKLSMPLDQQSEML